MTSNKSTSNTDLDLLSHIRELVSKGVTSIETLTLDNHAIPYENRCGLQAILMAQSGRFQEALEAADNILEEHPDCPDALFAKVISLSIQQLWTPALAASDRLNEIMETYPNALWLRAGILRQVRGDTEPQVLEAYNRAINHDDLNIYARMERADVFRSTQQYENAQLEFNWILERCNGDEELRTEAQFKLACIELVLGNRDAARALITAVLNTAPDYPNANDLSLLLQP